MASQKSLSNQDTVKKKIPNTSELDEEQFSVAENPNCTEFQQQFSKQNGGSVSKLTETPTMFTSQPTLPDEETAAKAQVSPEIASLDSNVNKLQRVDTGFLPETLTEVRKSHVTFSELANSMAKENHSGDSVDISGIAPHSWLQTEKPSYDGFVPQGKDWEHITEDRNEQTSSSVEQNRSQESLFSQRLSPSGVDLNDREKTNEFNEEPPYYELPEVSERHNTTNIEDVPSVCKSSTDNLEADATESSTLQTQFATAESLSKDATSPEHKLHLKLKNRLESLLSQYRGEGQIVVHRSYPGVVEEDCLFNSSVPRVSLHPVQESARELYYDDSVFPSNHKLSTSEEMRAAMMQARKQTFYRQKVEAAPQFGVEGRFGVDECLKPNYSRFTHPARSNLQLKYRDVMAALHRRAFKDWKSQTSASAGQAPEPRQETNPVPNGILERLGYLYCPRCYRPVSGIYGKPCLCQKVKFNPDPIRCNSNSEKRNRINDSRIQDGQRILAACTQNPEILPKTAENESLFAGCKGEIETRNKFVKAGLLGDTETESLNKGSKSNKALMEAQAARAAGEIGQFDGQAGDSGRLAHRPDRRKLASLNKTRRSSLKGQADFDQPDRKSRPLREWEIKQLEATLKKCLS